MPITINDVEHIAKLATLELTAAEKEMYATQLDSIFHWVEQLDQAPVDYVAPTAHVHGIENVLRDDEPETFQDREAILKNAPLREFDFVKVRKVIE